MQQDLKRGHSTHMLPRGFTVTEELSQISPRVVFQNHLTPRQRYLSTQRLICGFVVTEKTSYPLTHWPLVYIIQGLSVTQHSWHGERRAKRAERCTHTRPALLWHTYNLLKLLQGMHWTAQPTYCYNNVSTWNMTSAELIHLPHGLNSLRYLEQRLIHADAFAKLLLNILLIYFC